MWSKKDDLNKKVLVDSDVLRHFIKGKCENRLIDIFPTNLFIIDIVEAELCRSRKIKPIIQELISNNTLKRMRFPSNQKIRLEYLRLTSQRTGNGESACMAIAKYREDVIASNNLKDIKNYCDKNNILYLTTIDILCIAYFKNILTEAEIDYFLYLNIRDVVPSKIPFETLKDFLDTNPVIASLFN